MNNPYAQNQESTGIQAPLFRLSANPKKAVKEMIEAIDRLHLIYEQETKALQKTDTASFMALQDAKINAAREYQQGIEQMIARKEEIKNVEPSLRTKLQDMQCRFSQMARENMKALQTTQRAVERFGGTLREAAKDVIKKQRSTSYTAYGRMASDDAKRISTGSISETA